MLADTRVLTIDDSATIRQYLAALLTQLGASVVAAGTGRDGLEKLADSRADLVLLDLMLPDLDGLQVLSRIRELDDSCAVVILTGEGGIKSATAALQNGADGYIEKKDIPADHEMFAYALEKALERRYAIHEQRRLQTELAEKVEQLRVSEQRALEASRAKSTFLATMSHELRTPLNAILGFIQIMERDPNLSTEQRENLAIIARSGEHLLSLINDVLSLSKLEAGQLAVVEKEFNLRAMLEAVVDMFRSRAAAKAVAFELEVAAGVPRFVRGDEAKLRQVLVNLLGNAFKFTDRGRVCVRVDVSGETLAFEVTDTGPGISAENLERLFDAFSQGGSGVGREGTGLGLAISRNFVRLMGGDFRVETAVGKGTSFQFEVSLPEALPQSVEPERRKVIGLEPGQPSYRMLVADDRWENRTLLVKVLASVGFQVKEASDGREAVMAWASWQPHMIWMDVRMPVLDGASAVRLIRTLEAGGDDTENLLSEGQRAAVVGGRVPIVALTASTLEQDREEMMKAGCDDYTAKPFREATIFEKVARVLGVRYSYRDSRVAGRSERQAEESLGSARLALLSEDLLHDLHTATFQGDMEAACKVVDRIQEYDEPLAMELRGMVRRYDFDHVLNLIESVLPQPTSEG
jgi:signal transduction histidine kinase